MDENQRAIAMGPPPFVYSMRMSRVNVYLPDELAEQAKEAGLNISNLTQEAIRSSLSARDVNAWKKRVAELQPTHVSHLAVMEAVTLAKQELEGG